MCTPRCRRRHLESQRLFHVLPLRHQLLQRCLVQASQCMSCDFLQHTALAKQRLTEMPASTSGVTAPRLLHVLPLRDQLLQGCLVQAVKCSTAESCSFVSGAEAHRDSSAYVWSHSARLPHVLPLGDQLLQGAWCRPATAGLSSSMLHSQCRGSPRCQRPHLESQRLPSSCPATR